MFVFPQNLGFSTLSFLDHTLCPSAASNSSELMGGHVCECLHNAKLYIIWVKSCGYSEYTVFAATVFLLQFFCSFTSLVVYSFFFFFWTVQIRSALFPLFDTIDDTNSLYRFRCTVYGRRYSMLVNDGIYSWLHVSFIECRFYPWSFFYITWMWQYARDWLKV